MKKKTGPRLSTPAMVGGIGGLLLIVCAIALSTGNFFAFFSLEGLMVVGGGVLASAYMSYHENDVRAALRAIRDMFRKTPAPYEGLEEHMADILGWAQVARVKGLRGLELSMGRQGVPDPFVRYGLDMVISNYAPDEVRAMMETAADACHERDSLPAEVLQSMASHAPAFGMIGTLVGMVTMLCNLSDNVTGIGASLAVAFLSTLYGVVSARMIYMPAAAKLMQKIDETRFRNHLITEGMVMLVANRSPQFIQDRLGSFLRPGSQAVLNAALRHRANQRLEAVRA